MLPRENRLENTKDVGMVLRGGKGLGADFLFLKLIKNNLKVTRFAFVVSRKVARRAVHRNQIKRRLRAAVAKRLAGIKDGFDAVIITQKDASNKNFQETAKAVDKILEKLNLLKT